MDMSNAKIVCPECGKVYSINNGHTSISGKRSAKCSGCDKKFFVEFRTLNEEVEWQTNGVIFLRSYFEKRSGFPRRKLSDRRMNNDIEITVLSNLSNDVIPLFNNDDNTVIGHISPGRRGGGDRRSGSDRREISTEQQE